MNNKDLLLKRILFFLLLIFFSALAFKLLPDQKITPKENEGAPLPIENLKPTVITSEKISNLGKTLQNQTSSIKTNSQENTALQNEKKYLATLAVNEKKYNLFFEDGENLYTAMKNLQSNEKDFTFTTKEYPNLGIFVEKINNLNNNPTENKFWIYYINGQSAKMGISLYKLKQNDLVEWKYKQSEF